MNCKCGGILKLLETDSRQEWTEYIYECPMCHTNIIRRTEYDQNGLITSDVIKNEMPTM